MVGRTAMYRRALSAPARYLLENGLIQGRTLDYGSGRGKDAEVLGIEAYDPYWGPELPRGRFGTVLVTYVLNVLPRDEAEEVVGHVRGLLCNPGRAYFSVRRDIRGEIRSSRGTLQREVVLDLPVVYTCGGYCIYSLSVIETDKN